MVDVQSPKSVKKKKQTKEKQRVGSFKLNEMI